MKRGRSKPATSSKQRVLPRSKGASLKLRPTAPRDADEAHWTFLTNHTHVLVVLSRNPSLVLREVALKVGITERAVQRIITDLESAGVIERAKVGRRNQYRIHTDQRLRHANESHRTIGELLAIINRD